MKISRKLKWVLNPYNLAILGSIALIIISIFMFFAPEEKVTPAGVEVATKKMDANEEISEEDAVRLAKKQFDKLGEKNLNDDKLEVLRIQKKGEKYYYISSPENTVEIKIKGGAVTMINSAIIEE